MVLLSLQACAVGALLSRLLDVCYNRGLQVGDSGVEVFRNVPCAVLPEGEVSPWGEIMPGDVLGGSWMREKGRQGGRCRGGGGEKECKDEEENDGGRLRNVVGAEIRGIHSIMGGSYPGQYQSVQTPQFTLYHISGNDEEG